MGGTHMRRRTFLALTAGLPAALNLLGRPARAQAAPARRFLVFYFPDGVAGPSQDGQPSLWHPRGGLRDFELPAQLAPLDRLREHCVFLDGLSMGPTDAGSHPGGAKKLLTAVDGGHGESIDHVLARTVGADAPHRHVYLGVQANQNGASGDKHISYPSAGHSTPPEDDPVRAFERLFGGGAGPGLPGGDPAAEARAAARRSILDAHLADLNALRGKVGAAERSKLDLHTEALRDLERRLAVMAMEAPPPPAETCDAAPASVGRVDRGALYAPEQFPALLRAQSDLLVQAMACGLTRVGVLQASHHTSELVMSRFAGTEMHDPGYDMRSHQASHYGPRHDPGRREFAAYVQQRRYWVQRFADLVEALRARPEGDGTMLDYTVLLLCTEVCDGNTHQHDDMPFVLAGRGGGALDTGRLLRFPGRRHGGLFASIAQAMGHRIDRFGDAGEAALPGLVGA